MWDSELTLNLISYIMQLLAMVDFDTPYRQCYSGY